MAAVNGCIFCKIIRNEIPAEIIDHDEHAIVIKDINPAAPTHWLVIPKIHVQDVSSLNQAQDQTLSNMATLANKVAVKHQLSDFRLVINNGSRAGQSVFHLHMHVLGNRTFSWPPG